MTRAPAELDTAPETPFLRRLITLADKTRWSIDEIDPAPVSDGEYEPILSHFGFESSGYVRALRRADRERLARQLVAHNYSQIWHGEQAALVLAASLASHIEDLEARIFAAQQAGDEARHVLAVRRIVDRLGPVYPCTPRFQETLDALLACETWPKQVLGLQLFVEAKALFEFRTHALLIRDAVFVQATENIQRDESRHVAFGVQYLKEHLREMTAEAREDLVSYAMQLAAIFASLVHQSDYRAVFDEAGLDFDRAVAPSRVVSPPSARIASAHATLSLLQQSFERWFLRTLCRVGLADAIRRAGYEVPRADTFDGSGRAAPESQGGMKSKGRGAPANLAEEAGGAHPWDLAEQM
ncbi:MAG: ferritin-like domain-containing protein [Deltaproteobacteria bacterium]|nr:ferritin-like domain-containing protein [Deltaproteobacteria bacterium]